MHALARLGLLNQIRNLILKPAQARIRRVVVESALVCARVAVVHRSVVHALTARFRRVINARVHALEHVVGDLV